MALDIARNGIVFRKPDGTIAMLIPGRNGGAGTQVAVPEDIGEAFRLTPGDIVEGEMRSVSPAPTDANTGSDRDEQCDEPSDRIVPAPRHTPAQRPTTHLLASVTCVNGLSTVGDGNGVTGSAEADSRPFPKSQRSRSEYTVPDRLLTLAASPHDMTGRMLDFAAPLGAGVFGIIYGPHGSGLTRTLQSVVNGIVTNAPDCVLLVLLLRPRAEEATEWRRRFPEADVVVGASAFSETPPEQTLQLCDLMLEAAQRQTELGRDVVLLVDSLTALWGTMLEAEEADAQREADLSAARRRMQEWVRRAGCFHGQGPLGGGLGGSLTLIGTVWHQSIDTEAEEENDLHPHLRLLEYVLPEARWLVPLSETLSRQRLYPTINVRRCRSQDEERLLPEESVEAHLTARGSLPAHDASACYIRLLAALDASHDQAGLIAALR